MYMTSMRVLFLAVVFLAPGAFTVHAQAPGATGVTSSAGAPRQSGTVKAITPRDFVLTTTAGQDYAVTVPPAARILVVPPGSKDLSAAQPGAMSDISGGDRVLVNGTAGDMGTMLTATRVIVMKSNAIAASHAAEEAAWTRGVGGIVRSIDPGTGVITLASGLRTLTIDTTATTIVRRYSGQSVRFEDAVKSTVGEIHPGDQLRARGQRSADGTTVIADEIVTGSFSNFSGVLAAVDTTMGTVTLKDLASKRTVTVAVSDQTNVRRLPPGAAQMMGSHAQGGGAQDGQGAGAAPAAAPAAAGNRQAGAEVHAGAGSGRPGGAGADLSRMLNRLPTVTLADLKQGDAVMIVASNSAGTGQPTAITLLAGVEQILAAHPSGETQLSPWTLGGSAQGDAGTGDGGGGGGSR